VKPSGYVNTLSDIKLDTDEPAEDSMVLVHKRPKKAAI